MWISKDINKTTIETNFDKTYCLLSRIVSIFVYDLFFKFYLYVFKSHRA